MRIDVHRQPGTGDWSVKVGLALARSGDPGTWDASVLGRARGTSTHRYRYGETVLYNAGFTSTSWRGMQLLAQINGRWASRDRLEDGAIGENTCGMVPYAGPGVRWRNRPSPRAQGQPHLPGSQRIHCGL